MISYLANPYRFMTFSRYAAPICFGASGLMIAFSVWQGLWVVPAERVQGDSARILFVHVPAAILTSASYSAMAVVSFVWFVWRHELADIAAKCIAPFGAIYTALCLASGSIWGRPTWGTWWEWDDPRMVSSLVMLFLFLGYIALRAAMDTRQKAARAGAILAMVGIVNVPLIRFSVEWFTSIHQGSSLIRTGGPSMTPEYLVPVIVALLGHSLLLAALVLTSMRTEIIERRTSRSRAALLAGA
ncbi:MAG: heme ABC transporter permease CcmC [Pseudomonadota bacterium]